MSPALPWRQAAFITLGAAAALAGFYLLPAGSSLTPMDFLADKATVLQFCDPRNTRPLEVSAARPAVTLALAKALTVDAASRRVIFTLTTISGKPVGPADLLPRGQPKVRVAITGQAGAEAFSGVAAPGARSGEWSVDFVPLAAGRYHIAATFTPAATGSEIAAAGDLGLEKK